VHNVAAAAAAAAAPCLRVHRLDGIVGMEGGARSVVSLGPVSATVLMDEYCRCRDSRDRVMYVCVTRRARGCTSTGGFLLRLPRSVVFGGLQRTFMARFS